LVNRLGIEEGKILSRPIIEFYLKNDELNDPIISEEHIIVFDWASHEELESIISISQRVNDFLTGYFYSQKIRLVDFKLEFGRLWENQEMTIMIADEISPDNCRLWDLQTNEKLDKDRFRQDLGNVDRAYKEVAYRLGVLSEKEFKKVLKNDI
jgi:phosphoribosylaminoimidazole-succinocarboxamide synthase